ncbi:hypothetical protein PybrP1_000552, partial [[Pythium] brassicae (nom. inval.)]
MSSATPLQTSAAKASTRGAYGSLPADDNANTPISVGGPRGASLFSRALFTFANPLMRLGNERQLSMADLWELEGENVSTTAYARFKAQFERAGGSIPRAMIAAYGLPFLICGLGALFSAGCAVFAPAVLHHVIDAFTAPQVDMADLTVWLGAFFASRLLNAVAAAQMGFYLELFALRLTVAMKALLFQKALRRSTRSKNDAKAVDISNLYTSDVNNVLWAAFQINSLWILPLQIGVVIYMLYAVIGLAAFAGLAVIGASMLASFQLIQAKVSLARMAEFLAQEEVDPSNVLHEDPLQPDDVVIAVEDASFAWSKDATAPLLQNVSLRVKRGDLVVVHGVAANYKVLVEDGALSGERHEPTKPRRAFAPTLSPRELQEAHAHETEESQAALADAGRLVTEEERVDGRVAARVFLEYFRSVGGLQVCAFLLVVQTLWQVSQIGSDLWLSHWTGQKLG